MPEDVLYFELAFSESRIRGCFPQTSCRNFEELSKEMYEATSLYFYLLNKEIIKTGILNLCQSNVWELTVLLVMLATSCMSYEIETRWLQLSKNRHISHKFYVVEPKFWSSVASSGHEQHA